VVLSARPMRMAIFSRSPRVHSTARLADVAVARGHEVFIIDPLACYMSISPGRPSIHYRGEHLPALDAVIPRVGSSTTFYGAAVIRQLEMMGTLCVNGSAPIVNSRDKLACLQILASHGIDLPTTGFAHSTMYTDDLIDLVGGPPLVVKLLEGTQGIGVVLAETRNAAKSVIEAFRGLKADILVQEYIREASGTDVRCIVVGDRVVAAMIRRGGPGEFRSNLHRGGKGTRAELSAEELDVAVRSARALDLRIAGVDIIRSKRGPVVIEVNSSPGLEGIEDVSGVDVASEVLAYVETLVHEKSRL